VQGLKPSHNKLKQYVPAPAPTHPIKEISSISNEQYRKTLGVLIILIAGGFVGGFFLGQSLTSGLISNNLFPPRIYLDFNLEIQIQQTPLDIIINITTVDSSSPITGSSFRVCNITEWTLFELNPNTSTIMVIPHSIYYELLNQKNNTVEIKLRNADNMTVIKSASFML